MSQQEKSPLWIQSPEETSRVWIHGSKFSVPVPYYTQLKHTHTHTLRPREREREIERRYCNFCQVIIVWSEYVQCVFFHLAGQLFKTKFLWIIWRFVSAVDINSRMPVVPYLREIKGFRRHNISVLVWIISVGNLMLYTMAVVNSHVRLILSSCQYWVGNQSHAQLNDFWDPFLLSVDEHTADGKLFICLQ